LVEAGRIEAERLDPESLGLALAPLSALAGGDRLANATLLEAVLRGEGSEARADVVSLNTALVLWVAGLAPTPAAGLERARQALTSGAAWRKVEELRGVLPKTLATAE
jgi:anthranilate phosphoribosyltransferase